MLDVLDKVLGMIWPSGPSSQGLPAIFAELPSLWRTFYVHRLCAAVDEIERTTPLNILACGASDRLDDTPPTLFIQAMFKAVNAVQIRVSIDEIEPGVWRRLVLPVHWNLEHLHLAIQAAFNWWNYHLYESSVVFDMETLRF